MASESRAIVKARERRRVTLALDAAPGTPREFTPLLPPRQLRVEVSGRGPLVERVEVQLEAALRPGLHRIPLFAASELAVEVPERTRFTVRATAGARRRLALVDRVEVQSEPGLVIQRLVPALLALPGLFQDHDLSAIGAALERVGEGAGLLGRLGGLAARLPGSRFALGLVGEGRLRATVDRLVSGFGERSGAVAEAHVTRMVAEPVLRGDVFRLEPRFSGHLLLFRRVRVPFSDLRLPEPVIPSLHADLDRLISRHPFASAEVVVGPDRLEALAEALVGLVADGRVDLAATGPLPELELGLLLPDRSWLEMLGAVPERVDTRARVSFHAATGGLGLAVDSLEIVAGERRFAATGKLEISGARVGARLAAALRARTFPGVGLTANLEASVAPDSTLPPIEGHLSVHHNLLRGGLQARLALPELALAGTVAVRFADGVLEPRAEVRLVGRAQVRDGSRFDDGPLGVDFAGSSLAFAGRAVAGADRPLDLAIGGDAELHVRVTRPVAAFPELGIDDGELAVAAAGSARFALAAGLRRRSGGAVEADFGGTQATLTLDSVRAQLGDRELLLPTGSEVELSLVEATLDAAGLGRAMLEVAWDLGGRSPVLRSPRREIELFVDSLRRRRFRLELSPAGGLSATGEAGDLYDGRFWNALLNPGADVDRLLSLLKNEEAMDRVLAVVEELSADTRRALDVVKRVAGRARRGLDAEGIAEVGDALPGPVLARLLSWLLCDSPRLEARLLPLVRQVTDLAGTMAGNTLSAAAAYYTIVELEKPGVMERMFVVASDYVDKLNALFAGRGCGFFAFGFGGIIRIEMTAPHGVPITGPEVFPHILQRRAMLDDYSMVVHASGVLTRHGRDMVSCAHTTRDNDRAVAAFAALIDALQ